MRRRHQSRLPISSMGIFEAAVIVGAAARLTLLLGREDGPFGILARLRKWAGTQYNDIRWANAGVHDVIFDMDDGKGGVMTVYAQPQTELSKLLHCYRCLSVWVSIALVLAYLYFGANAIAVMLPFAVSMTVITIIDYLS